MRPDAVYCQVLPVVDRRLLVAHKVVVEILPLPNVATPGAPPPATVAWRAGELPLLCFECLCGDRAPDVNPRTRVAVLQLPGPAGEPIHAGLLIQGYPQMVPVEEDQLEALPLTAADDGAPVLFRVRFARGEMLIPDLSALARGLDVPMSPAGARLSEIAPARLQDADGGEGGGFGPQDAGAEPNPVEVMLPGEDPLPAVEPAFGPDEERD